MIVIARFLIVLGLTLTAIGGLLYLVARLGIPLGRLPGDIRFERQNFTCLIALGTSLLLSIVLTVLLNLLARLLNK
ncbi:MAG: DUF2905 domain-containing protein [Anaerolineales bacterium]|nr:DUF2905 domain-containing protein [Anaerolineales bacterium]